LTQVSNFTLSFLTDRLVLVLTPVLVGMIRSACASEFVSEEPY
jgi:hypothetical protein